MKKKYPVICDQCGKTVLKATGHINRARKIGAKLFCDQVCFGLNRRIGKTDEQKRAEKKAYDAAYRKKNVEMLAAKKRAYFKATYDPEKAAIERKKRMPRHVEYCRRPEYKAYKSEYDKQYRAKQNYGPFAEAFRTLIELEGAIRSKATRIEIALENGNQCKSLQRKRGKNEYRIFNR